MQRLIDANAVKENHERWIGYLDDDMIGRMNFAIDHHVPTVLTIPDNPTNGDIIKGMFPNGYFLNEFPFEGSSLEKFYVDDVLSNPTHLMVTDDWWNSPYKRGSENGNVD